MEWAQSNTIADEVNDSSDSRWNYSSLDKKKLAKNMCLEIGKLRRKAIPITSTTALGFSLALHRVCGCFACEPWLSV